jgi:hypothetical protein
MLFSACLNFRLTKAIRLVRIYGRPSAESTKAENYLSAKNDGINDQIVLRMKICQNAGWMSRMEVRKQRSDDEHPISRELRVERLRAERLTRVVCNAAIGHQLGV